MSKMEDRTLGVIFALGVVGVIIGLVLTVLVRWLMGWLMI